MAIFSRFRRGQARQRPSVGPSRAPITYYRKQSRAHNNRLTKKGRGLGITFRLRRIFWLVILASLFFLFLTVESDAKLSLDNQTYHSQADYTKAVNQQFSALKNRFKPLVNNQAIVNSLESKFPELANVNINLPIYSRLPKVELKIAQPSFYLTGASGTYGQQVRYIVAANGKAVGLAQEFPQITGLPVITDQSNLPVKLGEVVLGQAMSQFILAVLAQCQQAKVPVTSFNLPKGSPDLELKTADRSYVVKFNLDGDPMVQTGQFLAAREQFDKNGVGPSQYLDVRVNGRVYSK
ncbi:hypothetical protein A3F65_01400 [Candidatus Saccharibacteria bacterium RIFCSPHIGHO2_12_FULL_47_16b]|nr:MAG: hypothetical protein A3F65_01400 [Candidatus Saccharibacteria bacterium RIFCSPHIGHO2_12_FULL_47_16b]OGL39181.1 MAG: hypothetical protein A3J32_02205 [Candidatus Saccharibacteria bacterium RIFCSPLOWO2_02_FULL_46_7]